MSKKRFPDYTGAIFLIFIGTVFLFQNFGLLPGDFWFDIFNYWPVLLILAGLKMLFHASYLSQIIIALCFTFFLGFTLTYSINTTKLQSLTGINLNLPKTIQLPRSQIASHVSFSVPEDEYDKTAINQKNIFINSPVSKLLIKDQKINDYLRIKSTNFTSKPTFNTDQQNNHLNVEFGSNNPTKPLQFSFPKTQHTITLGQPEIPSSFDIQLGVGAVKLDITNSFLQLIKVNQGVGSTNVTLSATSIPLEGVSLKTGIGSINLFVSADIPINLTTDIGIGSVHLNNQKITNHGSHSHQPHLSSNPLTLHVKIGVGSLQIITVKQ
ncbi:LiaI-LiaF-like domain-containing protein [Pseudomonadota bacterium]